MGQKQPPTFATSAAELAATTDADGRNYWQCVICVIVSRQSTVGRVNPATSVCLVSRRRGRRPWLRRWASNGPTHRSMLARKTVTSHERRQSRLCRIQEICTARKRLQYMGKAGFSTLARARARGAVRRGGLFAVSQRSRVQGLMKSPRSADQRAKRLWSGPRAAFSPF
jgi:hypothetical protein